jgi:acetoacetyl-CoA reductase/3-oxoacyl-[acyl-carrier protein] reductase
MNRLEGKVALVTGASRSIGRAIGLALAREGAQVAINYRSNDCDAAAVAAEIESFGGRSMLVKADVSDVEQARAMVRRVVEAGGRLDILVNNAGVTRDRTLRKMTDRDWLEVVNTNLNSVYYGFAAAAPVMIAQRFGRIINVSSFVGQAGNFGLANYAASKGGIIAFTKSAALELAKYNVTVNALAPGFTQTDMLAQVPEEAQAQIRAKIPLGRFAQPDEVAKAVLFAGLRWPSARDPATMRRSI